MYKILFVIQNMHDIGGSQRVAAELAAGLCNNFEIDLLYIGDKHIAYDIDPKVTLLPTNVSPPFFPWAIKKHLKKNNYDLIISHTMNKLTLSLLLVGIKSNQILSLEHISHSNNSFLIKLLKKVLYRKLKGIITLTERDKKYYNKLNNNVVTIPNFSPYSIASYNLSKSKKVIAIGTLDKRKAFDRLLRAWALVEKANPHYELAIYGEGPEKANLEAIIRNFGLTRVSLAGTTNEPDKIYKSASIFAMTSRFEGLPMVLIEAQSFGIPIVAFDCPFGPREIINDGADGFLIEDGDIESFASKLLLLMEQQHLQNKLSEQAKVSATRFCRHKIINQWKTLIYNAVGHNGLQQ